jgi:phenylacetate-CoA ligase
VTVWARVHPAVLRFLSSGRRPSLAELRAFQDQQIRRLVRHAGTHVPFYRKLYRDAGVDVSRFRGIDDLHRLPFLTRQHLQQTPPEELVAEGIEPSTLVIHRSSGSTGIPIAVRRLRGEELLLQGIRLRALATVGLRPWDRRARVVYVPKPREGERDAQNALAERRGLFPYRNFSGFAPPEESVRALAQYNPAVITGHPGFLDRICDATVAGTGTRLRPRLVACAGEILLAPIRRRLAEIWRARVADFYAAHEFNLIAWERENGGPREVSALTVAAEIEPAPSGSRSGARDGELVGTALWSFAAPIIRYRLGDEVELLEADAQTGLALQLGEIRGRRTDRFVTQQGDTWHAYQVVESLLDEPFWFQCYRLQQNAPGQLFAHFVPLPGIPEEQREERARQFRQTLAPAFQVEWAWIAALPPETNGKRRLFARNVPLPVDPPGPES